MRKKRKGKGMNNKSKQPETGEAASFPGPLTGKGKGMNEEIKK